MTIRPYEKLKSTRFVLLAALACTMLGLAVPAFAAANPIIVNSTVDSPDSNPGNQICADAANECTLRAAIQEANEEGSGAEIDFSNLFKGDLASTITIATPLPAIVAPSTIIEAGTACNTAAGVLGPCVGINSSAGGTALEVKAREVTIKGLAVTGAAIGLKATEAAQLLSVSDNWFGKKLNGTLGADSTGIEVVGEAATLEANQVVGGEIGIHTAGADGHSGSSIRGNSIAGTSGSAILIENELNGVFGNQVSGSGAAGIRVHSFGTGSADENRIGGLTFERGTSDPDENVIDDSVGPAIELNTLQSTANEIYRNRGAGNAGGFIVFKAINPGTEPNGPNEGIQPPVISTATSTGASGSAEPEAVVRVFLKTATEEGEIASFLRVATADEHGSWSVTYPALPGGSVAIAASQTSEVKGSSRLKIVDLPPVAPVVTAISPAKGPAAGHTAVTITGEHLAGATEVRFGATAGTHLVDVSDTSVTVESPAGTAGAKAAVTVITPGGTSATSPADQFEWEAASTTPPDNGGSNSGNSNSGGSPGSGGSSGSGSTPPKSTPARPKKPLQCKAGFKKKTVKGKPHCVKVKKAHKKHL
jgi:CSLREA domain-containing protein